MTGENIFSHIESIEMRRAIHQAKLDETVTNLEQVTKRKGKRRKYHMQKYQEQIDYSKRQIAMIQKEWDHEDKMLREKHPDLFNMSDEDLLKELLG